jgi:hypothetical protein
MRLRIATLVLAALAVACAASAQDPGFQLTAGVDTPKAEFVAAVTMNDFIDVNMKPTCFEMALPCLSGKTFPDVGWSLSGARAINDWLSLTGEIAVANNVWSSQLGERHPDDNHVYSFMLGPRITTPFMHKGGRDPLDFRLFGQFLFGAETAEVVEGGNAKRPGVGIDMHTRSGMIVRMQYDYTLVQQANQPRKLSSGRLLVGVVFGIY